MKDLTRGAAANGRWHALFPTPKPVLAMLHLGGDDAADRLSRARNEAAVLLDGGVDAVIVENYFGDVDDVRRVLDALANEPAPKVIGLNVLRDAERAFALAEEFPVGFVQIDSVAGHLAPDADLEFAARLAELRANSRALVLGGVRFKYQPVNSGRSEAEDLALGAARTDGIVVTGDGTGIETAVSKIERFREALGPEVPLIVGAGVTDANAAEQLRHADGAIVGSFFKDTYRDTGVVDADHVARFMAAVARVRSGQ
ncbi:BtpA/SgcQ family protein [Streptomyces sp. NPDC049906]|uniref:BtpA/SgcQ family protein n=1 Tax=Streptomyces sp. NPDC049906 TaxID=3155656 RepID=UPI003446136F